MSLKIIDKNIAFSFLDNQIAQFAINPLTSSAPLNSPASAQKTEAISKQKIIPLSQPATKTIQSKKIKPLTLIRTDTPRNCYRISKSIPKPPSSAHICKTPTTTSLSRSRTYSNIPSGEQITHTCSSKSHPLTFSKPLRPHRASLPTSQDPATPVSPGPIPAPRPLTFSKPPRPHRTYPKPTRPHRPAAVPDKSTSSANREITSVLNPLRNRIRLPHIPIISPTLKSPYLRPSSIVKTSIFL